VTSRSQTGAASARSGREHELSCTGWARRKPTHPRRRSRPKHASLDRPQLPCRTRRTIKVLGYCLPALRHLGYTSAEANKKRRVFEAPRRRGASCRTSNTEAPRSLGHEAPRTRGVKTGTYAYWLLQSGVFGTGDMPSWLMGTTAKSCA
jgi:hypothetical protein